MKEIKIEDKEQYLKEHQGGEAPDILDKKKCLHCGAVFYVGEYKVFLVDNEIEYICCPKAPECDGKVWDWIPPDK